MEKKPLTGRNLQLDRAFFENEEDNLVGRVGVSTSYQFIFDRIEIPEKGGILRHYKGCLHPAKGMPNPHVIWHVDLVKQYTMTLIRTLSMRELIFPMLSFLLLRRKTKIKVLGNALELYCGMANRTLSKFYLKEKYHTECARAIWNFIKRFLIEIGINESVADNTGKIFATMIENDDMYRLRIEDVFNEIMYGELIKYPTKTIDKMLNIFKVRDKKVSHKFIAFGKIIKLALILPWVRKAFRKALTYKDFHDMQLDERDHYHSILRTGYDFFGMTDEERVDLWLEMHGDNLPERVEIMS